MLELKMAEGRHIGEVLQLCGLADGCYICFAAFDSDQITACAAFGIAGGVAVLEAVAGGEAEEQDGVIRYALSCFLNKGFDSFRIGEKAQKSLKAAYESRFFDKDCAIITLLSQKKCLE